VIFFKNHLQPITVLDYPFQLSGQLQQLLRSLRKSRKITQAELAQRLGVVQSRIADIERDPGAVSVEQLLQVLAILGAQMVVRDPGVHSSAARPSINLEAHAQTKSTGTARLPSGFKPALLKSDTDTDTDTDTGSQRDDERRGQW
jgi:HTH-type transcriptional regulator/antitoxin HipB